MKKLEIRLLNYLLLIAMATLMIGIELDADTLNHDCTDFVKLALEQHLLINVTAGNVIRLLPPLILDKQQADIIINTVSDLVTASLQNKAAA